MSVLSVVMVAAVNTFGYVAWLVLLTLFDLSTVGAAEVVEDETVVSACAEAPYNRCILV